MFKDSQTIHQIEWVNRALGKSSEESRFVKVNTDWMNLMEIVASEGKEEDPKTIF